MIKRCVCFPVLRLMLVVLLLTPFVHARAQEGSEVIPVPPQRPKILKVSPAYIEELRRREMGNTLHISPEIDSEERESSESETEHLSNQEKEPDYIPVPPKPPVRGISNNDALHQEMIDATKAEILKIIGEPETKEKNPPPQAPEGNRTLISFSLPPQEIALNEQIRSFLTGHALPLFNKNQNFVMEINAYATPIAGEEYSEIRISLARALEIRKFLIEHNISPTRLKLNQMSADENISPDDRVDLILIE